MPPPLTLTTPVTAARVALFEKQWSGINAGGAIDNGCPATVSPFGTLDRILFNVDAVNGLTSEVLIRKDVSINPNGETVTISGDGTSRVLTVDSASVSMDRLFITGGSSTNGGGIGIQPTGSLSLNNSTITNNQASNDGGGVFVARGASLSLNNSTISNNTAQDFGGGIHGYFNSTVLITNSTVSANSASSGGGILSNYNSTLTMINSTITENVASGGSVPFGGGLRVSETSLTLYNNLIMGNQADRAFSNEFASASQSLTNSFIKQNLIGSQYSTNLNLQNNNIIVNANELPNILSPLADNGGPTLTHALPEDSPAIDAGDSTLCAAAPINNRDQRGEPRDANCDIGAFEFIEPEDGGFFVIPLKNGKTVVIPE